MRRIISIGALLIYACGIGQDIPFQNLSSPRNAIITHLSNLQPDNYNDSIAAAPFKTESRSYDAAIESAVKLKRVLDGQGIYIYIDEIPKNPNYYDSATKTKRFVLTKEYPKIFLLKSDNGNWYFSDSSIDDIDVLYEKTFRFGTGRLLHLLPKMGTRKILGLYAFQYIAIFILALFSTIIYLLFNFFTSKILTKLLRSSGYDQESINAYLSHVSKPTSIFIILLLLVLFTPSLQLPPSYSHYVILILRVLLPLTGTIIAYRLVNIVSAYLLKVAKSTDSSLDDQLVPLLRKTLKTFVVIVGTLFILENLNVPILPLLTGLSIGGLAVALAAQDTLKNFFGSVMIFIDKPFQVGDWITSNDIDGTVEEVGFRSSRIRTFRNSLIYIPNGKLADNTIDNHGLRKYRRFYTQIAINYDTPPGLITIFVEGLREIVLKHPDTVKNNFHIYLNDMAASSLNIMFYIFFQVPDWGNELRARHEVLLEIMNLAKELGINFAYPTQTLHIENMPGKESLSPSYMDVEEVQMKMNSFFKK